MKQTSDGGYIVAGNIHTGSDSNVYLAYYDPQSIPPPPPRIEPTLDIKVNGFDQIVVTPQDPVYISASLDPGDYKGVVCDWYFCLYIPRKIFYPWEIKEKAELDSWSFKREKPSYFPEGIYVLLFVLDDDLDPKFEVGWSDAALVISQTAQNP